jgi:hypothetical protein
MALVAVVLAFAVIALPAIVTPTPSPPGSFSGFYVLSPVATQLPPVVANAELTPELQLSRLAKVRRTRNRIAPPSMADVRKIKVDRAATDLGDWRSRVPLSNINGTP